MEHYAKFVKIGGGVWSVVVMERDESEDVHELARDYTDAERGTLDVLADLGWEPIGTEQTPIVSGAGMGYSRPVRRRATPDAEARNVALNTFADLALSASVHDVADLSALLVFIVAADLVELLADFAEVIANDATVRNDRAELVERATSIVAARGYIPPADMIGTVRS